MAIHRAVSRPDAVAAEWLHWLFVQGDRAVSCSLDVSGDGTCVATLVPLWSPTDATVETFFRPADAVHWQEQMTRRLHAAGWRLVEGGIVRHAA